MPSSRPASVPADILAPSISISHVQEEDGSSSSDSITEGGEERRRVGPFAHLGCEGCLAGTCIRESEAKRARDEEVASEEEVVRLARLLDSLQERLNSLQVSHNTTVRNTQREIITLDLQGGAVEGMLRDVEKVRDVAVEKAKRAFDNRESLRRELGQSQVGLVGRFGARKYRMMKREERIEDKWAGVVADGSEQLTPTDGDRKSSTPSRSPLDTDHHRASVASAGTSTSSAAVNRFSKTHSVASSQQKSGGSKQSMTRRKSKLTDAVSQYLEKKPSASKRKGSGGSKLAPHIEEPSGSEVAVPPSSDDQPRRSDESEALDTLVEHQTPDTVESVVRSLDKQSMAEKGEAVLEWYKQKQQTLALADKPTSAEQTPTKQTTPALVPTPPPTTTAAPSSQSRLMSSRHLQAAKRSITNQAALLRPSERGINSTTV